MKKVQLNLNGKSVSVGGPTAKALRLLNFVRSIPSGKFFDNYGIANCLESTEGAIEQLMCKFHQEIKGHFLIIPNPTGSGRKRIYGSKPSIAKLAKDLQEQDVI